MTHAISDAIGARPLVLSPTTTVYIGSVLLGPPGRTLMRDNQPPEDFGFFAPETTPLAEEGGPPATWAEAYLMVGAQTGVSGRRNIGVDTVTADFRIDPRGGTAQWLYLSGMAFAPQQIRIGYRVTVQHS